MVGCVCDRRRITCGTAETSQATIACCTNARGMAEPLQKHRVSISSKFQFSKSNLNVIERILLADKWWMHHLHDDRSSPDIQVMVIQMKNNALFIEILTFNLKQKEWNNNYNY